MTLGVGIAVAAIVLALGFGAFRALTDGRFRGTRAVGGGVLPDVTAPEGPVLALLRQGLPGLVPGERATLVQFSSAFCAPCRATRLVLADVAERTPGVVHVEIDAEHHLELVRTLGVLRTPTTLILDGSGSEIARAAGAPRREQVESSLPARGILES